MGGFIMPYESKRNDIGLNFGFEHGELEELAGSRAYYSIMRETARARRIEWDNRRHGDTVANSHYHKKLSFSTFRFDGYESVPQQQLRKELEAELRVEVGRVYPLMKLADAEPAEYEAQFKQELKILSERYRKIRKTLKRSHMYFENAVGGGLIALL